MKKQQPRTHHKYIFKVGNKIVHGGITDDLQRREEDHQNSKKWTQHGDKRLYWSQGHIFQVGAKVTKGAALAWERENGYGANQ